MKIAINCRSFLNKNYTGIGRYAHSLVNSLAEIDQENQYFLYAKKKLFDTKRVLPKFDNENFAVKRDRFSRGLSKTVGSVDLYHSPSPDIVNIKNAKIIVTVHDLVYKTFPEGHTEETLRLTDEQFSSFLPIVSKVICSSKNTRADLHNHFDIEESKTCSIDQGIDQKVFYKIEGEEKVRAKKRIKELGIQDPFILTVGTIEPRKNLKGTLEAFAILKSRKIFDGKLVVVGMKGWKTEDIMNFVEKLGLSDEIIFPGFVSNDELRYLYNLSEVFMFPSLYEGFGYPIVEAFGCGAAVVTSNVSSCVEVAGEAGLTVDPKNIEQIVEAVELLLKDIEMKDQFVQKGLMRVERYNNLKTAQETLRVYKEVMQS